MGFKRGTWIFNAEQRSRGFCATDFDVSPENEQTWLKLIDETKDYLIIGREICPDTKRPHLQIYIYFVNPRKCGAFKKKTNGCHFEPQFGTCKEAITYCEKEGASSSWGVAPDSAGQGKRTDIHQIFDDIKEGKQELDIAIEHPVQWCQYRRSFDAFRQLLQPKRTWVTEVECIWGPPECGKSRRAHEDNAEPVCVSGDSGNPFISGYHNEPIVLFDDFDPKSMSREYILKLCDRYAMTINVKGGSQMWNPKKIYFTSNTDPREWYGGDKSWLRRITTWTDMTYKNKDYKLKVEDSVGCLSNILTKQSLD